MIIEYLLIYTIIVVIIYSVAKGKRLSQRISHSQVRVSDRACLFLIFFPIFILQTFKDPSSLPDLPAYESVFEETKNTSFLTLIGNGFFVGYSQEPGYVLINKLVSILCGNIHALFGLVGFVLVYCYATTIYRFSPLVPLSCLLFVIGPLNQSFFVLRQHFALAIMIFSFQYIIQRRARAFTICSLVAFFIHYTSITMVPLYFLYGIKTPKSLIKILLIILVVLKFGLLIIFSLAASLYGSYSTYLESDELTNNKVALFLGGILLVRWIFMKNVFWNNGVNKLLSVILVMGFILYFSGIGLPAIGRTFMGYQIPLCIILPQIIMNIKTLGVRCLVAFIFIGGMMITYMTNFHFVEDFSLSFF